MKFLGYIIAIAGWLSAAVIFRYGLYPPKLIFWLVLFVSAFAVSGLTGDKWAGLKLAAFIWVLVSLAGLVFSVNLLEPGQFVFSIIATVITVYFTGIFATKLKISSILKGLAILFLVFSLLLGSLYFQIEKAGNTDALTKADGAIILGAAVWEGGRPSPSMYARVKEGVKLYEAGLVNRIIVSGGLGTIPPTEAEVMGNLAQELGVPQELIILETQATTTEENIMFSKAIGEKLGFTTYIVVTDAFHLKRALLIAEAFELKAQGVPALESPLYTNKWLRFKYTLREAFALVQHYVKYIVKMAIVTKTVSKPTCLAYLEV